MNKAEHFPLRMSTDRTRRADGRTRLNLAAIPWPILRHLEVLLEWVQANYGVEVVGATGTLLLTSAH